MTSRNVYIKCKLSKQSPVTKRHHLSKIYELYFEDYLRSPDRQLRIRDKHLQAIDKSKACRTNSLGILEFACKSCGQVKYLYRSCKHRFCGRCGSADTFLWSKKMLSRLMDIPHHHVVFTLPKAFRSLSKMNEDKLHNELFRQSARIVKDWFNKKYAIKVGIVSVLHTGGSDLKYHPHVHMIVSRGGKEEASQKFSAIKGKYLCPQRELGVLFKEAFQKSLIKLYKKGELKVFKSINTVNQFDNWMKNLKEKHWIVSIQKPLENIEQIVGYVGRYTKRACLSEYKLESISNKRIRFLFNDYKNTPRGQAPLQSSISLKVEEFLDRLLQHVPKKSYRMVRYYGLYNSAYLQKIPSSFKLEEKLEQIESFEEQDDYDWGEYEALRKAFLQSGKPDPLVCQDCNVVMELTAIIYKGKRLTTEIIYENSS